MEVYVDDIMVKGKQRSDHIRNLAETFDILRAYKMKLNPAKCTFGVSSGRFLGYLVTQRGIEAHPKQIRAILEMKSPTTLKEIQSFTGRAAALNRFLSQSTDRCKPFFKAIKRAQRDKWDEECEKAFQDLKKYLTSPPLLSKPEAAEDLYIYLAVSEVAVSSALIREELGAQLPVFYTPKALLDEETRYPKIEKLILALVVAARKLRPYFQAHTVIVMTQYPLRSILHGPDASQRVMKWALELGQYGLVFRPRTTVKAQALADFVAEFAPGPSNAADEPDDVPKAAETPALPVSLNSDKWHLHVDHASNHKGSGAGVVLVTPDGSLLEQAITLGFKASNNEAEYEALLAGLRMAKDLAVKKLAIYSDSQLITSQTAGEYMAKHPRMAQYLEKVREQLNAHANALAGLGSTLDHQLKRSIPVEYLDKPSIESEPVAEVTQVNATPNWQSPIIDYLVNGTLPAERLESRKLQTQAARYYMWRDILVRRSYTGPHLQCLAPSDDLKVLSSIHEGVCGNHFGR